MNEPEYILADALPLHARERGMLRSFPVGGHIRLGAFLLDIISTNPKKNTISFKLIAIEKPKKEQKHDSNASNQNVSAPGVGTGQDTHSSVGQPEVGSGARD